jgi:hypothetical protein
MMTTSLEESVNKTPPTGHAPLTEARYKTAWLSVSAGLGLDLVAVVVSRVHGD